MTKYTMPGDPPAPLPVKRKWTDPEITVVLAGDDVAAGSLLGYVESVVFKPVPSATLHHTMGTVNHITFVRSYTGAGS